ncbi:bis(5'-nucleosyl)-tetraphosphatase [Aliidiomarina iranensis]|uniref:bis(5'-nucleosyl)-tetraphosphatase (symmetrical) n=1 Tax=Aliidiomarina iranensis TaxID=1434071 RepID=A0A432VVH4_9GAMM|nr:symmetrical bis(5'-nucleosyl)-tetraphosphatase [Aliidiomarina iranensis]RUO20388.1 bis(5'-nucleosyl)-tetraphosphatase [Aliidiomarina iranensis]
MARYLVGDIHGCLQPLQNLLSAVHFDPRTDELWAVGDLIGRGPQAQATLEFLAEMGTSFRCVLGNHDLHALAVLCQLRKANPKDRTADLARSSDRDYWIHWLRHQPLLLADAAQSLVVTHAGIHPEWSVDQASEYANEVALCLRSSKFVQFLEQMYGNDPAQWHADLSGHERIRFIVNVLTRMRYVTPTNALELNEKRHPKAVPTEANLQPWFSARKHSPWRIVFGHWASLMGDTQRTDIIGLDTGCVWGETLTAWEPESNKKISVPGWQR